MWIISNSKENREWPMLADDLIVFNCELNRIGLNQMREERKDVRKQNLVMTLLLLIIITFTKEPID